MPKLTAFTNWQKRSISRTITCMALLVALSIAIVVPVTFFKLRQQYHHGWLEADTRNLAHQLTDVVSSYPLMWQFQIDLLDDILNRFADSAVEGQMVIAITDLDDEIIHETRGHTISGQNWLADTASEPIYDNGRPIGHVVLRISLHGLLWQTLVLTLIAWAFAILTFVTLRQLPLRALNRAITEITGLARLEAEKKVQVDRLEESLEKERNLNALQRRFVSMVSHEFRTPLAIVDGKAQRLIKKGDGIAADARGEDLKKIRVAVGRLVDLMETMLSSAKLEAGTIEMDPAGFDLQQLVREICENQREIAPDAMIVTDIDKLPRHCWGDEKLLRQAILNIVTNAVKYSPDGKRIDVTGRSTDGRVSIAIRDHGVGIPESELPDLFSAYFRASTSTGIAGTGVGLSLVKAFVDMHGGDIEVVSTVGEGSTFTIVLPHQAASSPLVGFSPPLKARAA